MTSQTQRPAAELTARQLTAQLSEQLVRLFRAEVALAKAELFISARQAVLGAGMLTAAATVAVGGWFAVIAAVIASIASGLPVWAAALITGGALMACAAGLALLGVRRLARGMPPLKMTSQSIREELNDLPARMRT
jgi:Putative Actinobacterial Holin-X, holin superfamily III